MFDLKNKIAIITGGGSGIGAAISLLFARQGALVKIIEQNEANAIQTKKIAESEGGSLAYFICNVASSQEVAAVFSGFETIEILVNNAGIAHIGNLENTLPSDMDKIYEVNVKGYFNCMQAAIGKMKANKKGVILNMASVAAIVGIADRFAYSMSKGAVMAMTISVAKDYLTDGIRCNSISPARVHTPFVDGFLEKNYPDNKAEMFEKLSKTQPIGRMAKPVEIAALALYLCSDEAGFITGCDYPIDGGFVKLNS